MKLSNKSKKNPSNILILDKVLASTLNKTWLFLVTCWTGLAVYDWPRKTNNKSFIQKFYFLLNIFQILYKGNSGDPGILSFSNNNSASNCNGTQEINKYYILVLVFFLLLGTFLLFEFIFLFQHLNHPIAALFIPFVKIFY